MMTATAKFSDYWHAAMITAASACMLAGMAEVARAAEPARSVTVAYGDLNLASVQGTDALHARIVSAAREVCGASETDIRNLQALAAEHACESSAVTQAVQAVHTPALAVLYVKRQPQG